MTAKPPECWAGDASARAILIATSLEHSILLPFDHFLYVEFTHAEGEQKLHLFFSFYEGTIRGHSLRRLESALQRMELSHDACATSRYEREFPEGQSARREIVITATRGPDDSYPSGEEH